MNRLGISLLGSIKVQFDGADITETLRTKKERAILAYLAEEPPRSHARQIIAEFLWPDRPENYARMNLRQALLGIRKAFGGDANANHFIRINEETVQFLHKNVDLDTQEFNKLLHSVKIHPHPHLNRCEECVHHLEQAIEVYRGEFLEDLILGDVTGFQEWIVFHRERHFRSMLDALQSLIKIYYKQGNYDKAYFYAWRYVDLAPLEEGGHRLLMRLLALSGRRNAALQQYQFCRTIIEREFGIEPSAETKQLYAQIKSGLPIEKIDTGSLAAIDIPTQPTIQRVSSTGQLYDPSTRIPLRPLFMDRLKHAIIRMERGQVMAIVGIVSFVFPYNPEMSAEQQQQAEQHLVRRLVGAVREGDTVAKLQENEFGLILEGIKDAAVVELIAQKIVRVVGTPILYQGQRIEVKPFIGTSLYPADGIDPNSLLNQADIAMRTARLNKFD